MSKKINKAKQKTSEEELSTFAPLAASKDKKRSTNRFKKTEPTEKVDEVKEKTIDEIREDALNALYSNELFDRFVLSKTTKESAQSIVLINKTGMIAQIYDVFAGNSVNHAISAMLDLSLFMVVSPQSANDLRKNVVLSQSYLVHERFSKYSNIECINDSDLLDWCFELTDTSEITLKIFSEEFVLNIKRNEFLETLDYRLNEFKRDKNNFVIIDKKSSNKFNVTNTSGVRNMFAQIQAKTFEYVDTMELNQFTLSKDSCSRISKALTENAQSNFNIALNTKKRALNAQTQHELTEILDSLKFKSLKLSINFN